MDSRFRGNDSLVCAAIAIAQLGKSQLSRTVRPCHYFARCVALSRIGLAAALAAALAGCAMERGATAGGEPPGTVIYAVGDIAQCGNKPPSEAAAARTAALLRETTGAILALGDLAYPTGSYADFATCFESTWGELKPRILPVPGNHEYQTTGALPYYAYFAAAAGAPGKGYYSTRIGAWHVVALNSNIDVAAGSEQARWLFNDLAAHNAGCTLAFWHHPLFTSAQRESAPLMRDIWQILYAGGVDIVLNGHEHVYERFAPQGPTGAADPAQGIRQFIVGTGGANGRFFGRVMPNSEVRERGIFGALKLSLREDGYTWQFLPVAGQKFQESGEGRCHR